MKTIPLSFIAVLLLFSLTVAGCTTASTSEDPIVQALHSTATPVLPQAPASTNAPEPTKTPTPTATPEPIPCNIAFDSNRDGNREIYSMASDGSETVNLTNNLGDDFDPAWSPDGSLIAFVSNRENETERGQFIYVMNADGSNVHQLTLENESNWPDWSHDGSRITYTHKGDIYTINADGSGNSINLTNSPEEDAQSSWSPNGSQIVWLTGSEEAWNIKLMNADGSNVRQLTDNGKVTGVAWTVDGQLFTHWDNQEANCFNCVMDADGGNIKDAGGKGEIQRYLPFWTLDGNRVECLSVEINGEDNEIYLVGEVFPDIFLNLTNDPADDRNPDWPVKCGSGTKVEINEVEEPKVSGKITVGYAGDKDWQYQWKGDFQKACDELSIQCVYGEIPALIDQGVNAIIQNSDAISVNGLHEDILKARDKGIPVFLLDAETITDGAYSITIDQHQWAKTSLGWMFEKIGGEGQVAYFDLHPFVRYTDTINDMLSRYPGISVIDYRDGKYEQEKIKPETSDLVKAHPDLKAVWASTNMTDAIQGMEENGIPFEQWPVVTCEATSDGLEKWQKIKDKHPDFDCIASVNPPGIAYNAVYAAYYLTTGAKIDEAALGGEYGHSLYVPMPVITSDNLQEWLKMMHEEKVFYADEMMAPDEIREKWFLE